MSDSIDKIQKAKTQNLSKNKSLLIDKEQIDDENARGFEHVFQSHVTKQSASKFRDFENSLSSRGDSKFSGKSDQPSLNFQVSRNQNSNSSLKIHNDSKKTIAKQNYLNQISNIIDENFENKPTKVVNLKNQYEKQLQLKNGYLQQKQGFLNQNSSNNQLNQNSQLFHADQSNHKISSQLSFNNFFENADSINQLLKHEQINHNNNVSNGYQISSEQIQRLQLQNQQNKQLNQHQSFLNTINSQNPNSNFNNSNFNNIHFNNLNSNFNNDLVGGTYGGLNSMNDISNIINNNSLNLPFNNLKHEYNSHSNGQYSINQNKNDIFDDEDDINGLQFYWGSDNKVKEEHEDNTQLGDNKLRKLGKQAAIYHSKNAFSSNRNNQTGNNVFTVSNNKQHRQESILSSNPNDQTNIIDQARSQNEESNNNFDQDGDQNKTLRGLRILSHKVKEIVLEKGSTTYKEVADTLVQNLKNGQKQQGLQAEMRDEQNIKRRVYDALNVLIASEVIAKKGKKVLSIAKTSLTGKCLKAQNWSEAKKQQQILDKKKEREFAKKYLALKSLIERNKNDEKPQTQINSQYIEDFIVNNDDQDIDQRPFINSQYSNQQQNPIENILQTQYLSLNKFHFPLITVSFNSEESSRVILKMNKEKNNLKIYAKGYLQTLGDLDILCKMNLDQVSEDFRKQVLGERYLNFYNSLDHIKINTEQYDSNQQQEQYI